MHILNCAVSSCKILVVYLGLKGTRSRQLRLLESTQIVQLYLRLPFWAPQLEQQKQTSLLLKRILGERELAVDQNISEYTVLQQYRTI